MSAEFISQNNVLAAALSYASQGFPIVPCYGIVGAGICTCGGRPNCKPGKHPIPTHGHLDASTDPETIRQWWKDHPWANVAIASGVKMFVWDIDPRNGGDATMAALINEHGSLPITPTVATGGGGEQYYFRIPPGGVIKSRPVAHGIDVKGKGLVIAPPSMHRSGTRYTWVTPLDTPLAHAPDWLLAMATETRPPAASGDATGTGGVCGSDGGFTMGSAEPNDFASHPGADVGMRNHTMCRLLGVHLSRGDSPATVEALALAWAARCSPPIPEVEVLQRLKWAESKRKNEPTSSEVGIVRSFADGDAVGEEQNQTQTPPNLSTPDAKTNDRAASASGSGTEADDWPVLGDDAYYGLAGAIVRAIAPETEADEAGVLLTLLTAFGNVVGNSPHYAMMDGTHHANLFTAKVGDTASGKGRAWSIVHRLMAKADPEWEVEAIAYGLSSGEGLVERVKDDADDDDAFTMPNVKRLLCVEMEFARVITAMRREGNTLSPLLRSAWDSQTLEVLTRGKSKLLASNAHISVIAHITPEELAKLLSGSVEVCNGFSNRFIWACVKRSKSLPDGGDASVIDPFVSPLSESIAKATSVGIVKRGDDAKALWHGVYDALTKAKPGAFGMTTSRGHAQTLRLSLLYALLDGSDTITAEHLRAALAVWAYCEASARCIFGGDGDQGRRDGGQTHATVPLPLHLRLLDTIVKTPGINRKGLHEATGNRIKADDMEPALAILEAQCLAHRSLCQSEGGGRPAECWWPGPGDDPSDDDTSNDDTGDDDKGVTFIIGGGVAATTASASASAHTHGDVSIGQPTTGETEGDGAGLRTNEQTPAPTPLPEIISSQSMFAGGEAMGGGQSPPLLPELVSSFADADTDANDEGKALPHQATTHTTYPSPTLMPDDHAPPGRCSCGAKLEPGGDICETCFMAELNAMLSEGDSPEQTNPPIAGASLSAPPSSS